MPGSPCPGDGSSPGKADSITSRPVNRRRSTTPGSPIPRNHREIPMNPLNPHPKETRTRTTPAVVAEFWIPGTALPRLSMTPAAMWQVAVAQAEQRRLTVGVTPVGPVIDQGPEDAVLPAGGNLPDRRLEPRRREDVGKGESILLKELLTEKANLLADASMRGATHRSGSDGGTPSSEPECRHLPIPLSCSGLRKSTCHSCHRPRGGGPKQVASELGHERRYGVVAKSESFPSGALARMCDVVRVLSPSS